MRYLERFLRRPPSPLGVDREPEAQEMSLLFQVPEA